MPVPDVPGTFLSFPLSELIEETEVFLGADAQGSEVAFDLEHRQVFLSADDHRPDQVMTIPRSMIAFLAH